MKQKLIISFMIALCLLIFAETDVFAQGPGAGDSTIVWGSENKPVGNFCLVEKVNVCVVTKDVEDCKKLNGKKVDACPETSKEKVK